MAETNGKVVYFGEVLIDLTGDSVTENKVLAGTTFHGPDGAVRTGTCEYDIDSDPATATEGEVLTGKTFAARKQMRRGSMPNNGAVAGEISNKNTPYTVPPGYHDGSGTVGIAPAEKEKLIPENIRSGIEVLGVHGTMSPEQEIKVQSKNVKPTKDGQTVRPDPGMNYLTEVVIQAIPIKRAPNAAGGMTVTIGE